MALDKRNYAQLVETTVELANKVGGREIISRVVDDLKDESEPYRKMVMETIDIYRLETIQTPFDSDWKREWNGFWRDSKQ